MSKRIDITGKDKAEVLAVLFNRARPIGLGFLHFKDRTMSVDEALSLLSGAHKDGDFDYLEGRVMKVNLASDTFDPWLYDRDNGDGAAEKALREAGIL